MAREKLTYDILEGKNTLKNALQGAVREAGFLRGALQTAVGVVGGIAVTKGFQLLSDGIRSSIDSIGEFIEAASIQESAVNKLNTSLALVGGFSNEASQEIQSFASELQRTTGIGDETTLGLVALARNFTSTTEEAIALTSAAADLSAATGLSLDGSIKNLGKTFAGLTGELGESVPALRGLTAEQLRAGEGVKLIAQRFGGAAAAAAQTYAGQIKILSSNFGDLKETLGEVILGSAVYRGAVDGLNKFILKSIEFVKANKAAIIEFVENGILFLVDSLSSAATAFTTLNTAITNAQNFFNGLFVGVAKVAESFAEANTSVAEFFKRISDFAGTDSISAQLQKDIDKYKERADFARAAQQVAIDEAATRVTATQQQNQAVDNFTSNLQTSLRTAIDASKAMYEEDKNAFIESLNAKNEATTAAASAEEERRLLLVEARKEFEELQAEERLLSKQLESDAQFQILVDGLGKEQALRELRQAEELKAAGKHEDAKKKLAEANAKAQKNGIFQLQKFEDLSNKERLANLQGTLGTISTLTASSNKTLFALGKAAAISNATIDGISAVQKALASAPPPFSFILAGLVGAATAINIAKIASTQPPSFAEGGIVPGLAGVPRVGDNVMAAVNPGELILNETQQATIAGRLGGGNSLLAQVLSQPIIIEIDGREIARAVRNEQFNGFALA